MAFNSVQITLAAATPTDLLTKNSFKNVVGHIQDSLPLSIKNEDATRTVWIGGPNVSDSNGQSLAPGQSIPLSVFGNPTDIPFGYTIGTGVKVSVLIGRQ